MTEQSASNPYLHRRRRMNSFPSKNRSSLWAHAPGYIEILGQHNFSSLDLPFFPKSDFHSFIRASADKESATSVAASVKAPPKPAMVCFLLVMSTVIRALLARPCHKFAQTVCVPELKSRSLKSLSSNGCHVMNHCPGRGHFLRLDVIAVGGIADTDDPRIILNGVHLSLSTFASSVYCNAGPFSKTLAEACLTQ